MSNARIGAKIVARKKAEQKKLKYEFGQGGKVINENDVTASLKQRRNSNRRVGLLLQNARMVESDDEVDEFIHKSITFGKYKELMDNGDHLLSMQPWYCEY